MICKQKKKKISKCKKKMIEATIFNYIIKIYKNMIKINKCFIKIKKIKFCSKENFSKIKYNNN